MPTTLNQNPWAVEKGTVQKESNAGWARGLAAGKGSGATRAGQRGRGLGGRDVLDQHVVLNIKRFDELSLDFSCPSAACRGTFRHQADARLTSSRIVQHRFGMTQKYFSGRPSHRKEVQNGHIWGLR